MLPRFLLVSAIGLFAVAAPSQTYRWETIDQLKIAFRVHEKLEAIPEQFKADDPHEVARYRPKDDGDYIHGKLGAYHWDLVVYQFDKTPGGGPVTGDTEPTPEEQMMNALREKHTAKDFDDFVRGKDPRYTDTRKFWVEGRTKKGSSKRPDLEWWEWSDAERAFGGSGGFILWYQYAAVYDVGEKQIALVCILPVMKDKKPDRKYERIAQRMLTSLVINENADEDEDLSDEARDKYANTPERKAELDLLKANIRDFDNWDYFTTESFIIAFSWDRKDHRDKRPAYRFAFDMAEHLEDIRSLYREHYPPHPGMKENYSVIRVCSDYDEFLKYGEMPRGVVGWFSPSTKELCVFRDVDHVFASGEDEMLAVVYHEAWHQYADQVLAGCRAEPVVRRGPRRVLRLVAPARPHVEVRVSPRTVRLDQDADPHGRDHPVGQDRRLAAVEVLRRGDHRPLRGSMGDGRLPEARGGTPAEQLGPVVVEDPADLRQGLHGGEGPRQGREEGPRGRRHREVRGRLEGLGREGLHQARLTARGRTARGVDDVTTRRRR